MKLNSPCFFCKQCLSDLLSVLLLAVVCISPLSAAKPSGPWAIAIHGGISSHVAKLSELERGRYFRFLAKVTLKGKRMLRNNWEAVDVAESVVKDLEDSPLFNAGKGAVCNYDGNHELDASIMDGRDSSCGGVAGITNIRNPISLARKVMEKSRHVFLVGKGAERFAQKEGLEVVPNSYFSTKLRKAAWRRTREGMAQKDDEGSTVGCVVLDRYGNLAAATSTGGLTAKRWGRVGDSPVIGAGTWANNYSCAVSCTGKGEEFIRHSVARTVGAIMRFGGKTLTEAAEIVLTKQVPLNRGGLVAVDKDGSVLAVTNTKTMLFGMANSKGICRWGLYPKRVK